jgi:hypothetical protein
MSFLGGGGGGWGAAFVEVDNLFNRFSDGKHVAQG